MYTFLSEGYMQEKHTAMNCLKRIMVNTNEWISLDVQKKKRWL